MTVYLFLIVTLIMFAPVANINRRVYLFSSLFVIWIIMSLRGYMVGNDTLTYVQLYPQIAQQDLTVGFFKQMIGGRFEFGFILLVKFLYFFTPNPRLLIIVVVTVEILALAYFLENLSCDIPLSLILFVTMNFMGLSMSAMRQCLAMGLGMVAIVYLLKNYNWQFFLIIFIAGSFHKAAFVLLILYPMYKMTISFKTLALWLSIFVVAYLTFGTWFSVVTQQVTSYTNYGMLNNTGDSSSLGIILKIIELVIIIAFCILAPWPKKTEVRIGVDYGLNTWQFFLLMLVISIGMSFLALKFSQISRISIFFEIVILVLVPRTISLFKNVSTKFICSTIVVCSAVLYFYVIQIYRPEWYGIVPYVF